MEQEIDLRGYIQAVGRGWKWIVAGIFLTTLLLTIFYTIRPPTYQATALIAISRTQYELELEPRFRTIEETQLLYRAYPEIALSDQVIQTLLASDPSLFPNSMVANVRPNLTAQAGNDPSLIRLSVRHANAQQAAAAANLWAKLFIQQLNTIYAGESEIEISFLQEQLNQAEAELLVAEADLITFRQADHLAILQNQLNVLTHTHATLLAEQSQTQALLRDSQLLLEQLNSQNVADGWVSFLLQMRAYSGAEQPSIVWQIDGATEASNMTVAEQQLLLNGLIATLTHKADQLVGEIQQVEQTLLVVQSQYQQAVLEERRLTGNYELALEKQTTLARKQAESQIATTDIVQFARLASWAVTPSEEVDRYLGWRLLAGGVGIGLLGVALLVGRHWWQGASGKRQ